MNTHMNQRFWLGPIKKWVAAIAPTDWIIMKAAVASSLSVYMRCQSRNRFPFLIRAAPEASQARPLVAKA
jgi:hypothetical protein